MTQMRIDDLLFSQGFGTRRVCAGLVQQGHVRVHGELLTDASHELEVIEGMEFQVAGVDWVHCTRAYLVLNKPLGVECSQKPSVWPSVYSLLPLALRQRPASNKTVGVQGIGRLDQNTTGLLLLSDDGVFIHRMSSPKHHVPKIYSVTCAKPLDPAQINKLLSGVVLHDDPKPVAAAAAEQTGDHTLDLTLTEGKYHQVKRMLAAVGNEVTALHRRKIGQFELPADLVLGEWRWLTATELKALQTK